MQNLRLIAFTLLVAVPTLHYAEPNSPQTTESRSTQYKTAKTVFDEADQEYIRAALKRNEILSREWVSASQIRAAEDYLKAARDQRNEAQKRLQIAADAIIAAERQSEEDARLARQIQAEENARARDAAHFATVQQAQERALRECNARRAAEINRHEAAVQEHFDALKRKDPRRAQTLLFKLQYGENVI